MSHPALAEMRRLAVYYAPRPGAFHDRASAWLGRDMITGEALDQPDLGLPAAEITHDPRKYGFHGTIKAPFRFDPEEVSAGAIKGALAELAEDLAPVTLPGLRLADLHGFLALIPEGDTSALQALAASVVTGLDEYRAPLTEAEIAKRRPESLSPRQRELLSLYGYPHVLEEFRFHLTLTDRLPADLTARAAAALSAHFAPVLPQPFRLEDLCLFGEDHEGRFHLLSRHPLTGEAA